MRKMIHPCYVLFAMLLIVKNTLAGYKEPVYLCEGTTKTISCGAQQKLRIVDAMFGRKSYTICTDHYYGYYNDWCGEDRTADWGVACNDKESCTLEAKNGNSDPCYGIHKYLYVDYACDADYDLCQNAECFNGATCKQYRSTHYCDCAYGYAGETCAIKCPTMPSGCSCYSSEFATIEESCISLSDTNLPTFGDSPDVSKLTISNCEMEEIDDSTFSGFTNVIELVIENNEKLTDISSGAFEHSSKIETIRVQFNSILAKIKTGVFANIESLKHISLRDNKISIIEDGAFSNIPKLETLDLRYNEITCDDRPYIPSFTDDNAMWSLWGIPKDCDKKRSPSEEDNKHKAHGSVRFRSKTIDMRRIDS